MIDRKFLSVPFLQSVKRILMVNAEKKVDFKYLDHEVVEERSHFVFFKKKKVFKKGFYNARSKYIESQNDYYTEVIDDEYVVWSKPLIRMFYKGLVQEEESAYLTMDTNEEMIDIFNRLAEKVSLVEYT